MGSHIIAEKKQEADRIARQAAVLEAMRAGHNAAVENYQSQPPIAGDPYERHADIIKQLRTGIDDINMGLRSDKQLTFRDNGLDDGRPSFIVTQGDDQKKETVWTVRISDSERVGGGPNIEAGGIFDNSGKKSGGLWGSDPQDLIMTFARVAGENGWVDSQIVDGQQQKRSASNRPAP